MHPLCDIGAICKYLRLLYMEWRLRRTVKKLDRLDVAYHYYFKKVEKLEDLN